MSCRLKKLAPSTTSSSARLHPEHPSVQNEAPRALSQPTRGVRDAAAADLPPALLQRVLAEAELATVLACSAVNRAWRAVVKDVRLPKPDPVSAN